MTHEKPSNKNQIKGVKPLNPFKEYKRNPDYFAKIINFDMHRTYRDEQGKSFVNNALQVDGNTTLLSNAEHGYIDKYITFTVLNNAVVGDEHGVMPFMVLARDYSDNRSKSARLAFSPLMHKNDTFYSRFHIYKESLEEAKVYIPLRPIPVGLLDDMSLRTLGNCIGFNYLSEDMELIEAWSNLSSDASTPLHSRLTIQSAVQGVREALRIKENPGRTYSLE